MLCPSAVLSPPVLFSLPKMPSAGACHLAKEANPHKHDQPGKIKLRDNDNDKNNICAIKDRLQQQQQHNRSPPAATNVPQTLLSKVKVKCESRDYVVYLSLAGFILTVCTTALFIGLWWWYYPPTPLVDADSAVVFHRHLTSESSIQEIRRIIQQEMSSLADNEMLP